LGNPLDFILTQGQAHDLEGADVLLPDIVARHEGFVISAIGFHVARQLERPMSVAPF